MVNLDVAMLGSQPASGASSEPPRVAGTGHVRIDHLTRSGERVRAWYRGPLTPRQVRRRDRTTPFHSSDQARTIGGDFFESLGEAAAFEIGRMLALADPSFLQELLRWRRDGFRRLKTASQVTDAGLGDVLVDDLAIGAGRVLTLDLLVGLATADIPPLGPIIDPAGGLELRDDDAQVIATGLGTPVGRVRAALGIGDHLTVPGRSIGSAVEADITSFDELVLAAHSELGHLESELDDKVRTIVADSQAGNVRRDDG